MLTKAKLGTAAFKGRGPCLCPWRGVTQRGQVWALELDGPGFESQTLNLLDL